MSAPKDMEPCLARMSRELALHCSLEGRVLWMDDRAIRVFGEDASADFQSLSVPGTEGKARALLEAASRGPVRDWELGLVVGGRARTATFQGEPCEGGVLLLGTLEPDAHTSALGRMDSALRELGSLQRESERQRAEISAQHTELKRIHGALSDSNLGLRVLHAEIESKNESLRRASDVKERVVANVSHEFRTPINSILGITQLLLDRFDGDLTAEQEKQLRFVRQSAEALHELVNDLLDLSRIEAGKTLIRAARFPMSELFGSMRGVMSPLFADSPVKLVVEEPAPDVELYTDQGKVAQILRNLVSNALKFTEEGEVRMSGRVVDGKLVEIIVKDTGIGIAPKDRERIFEEFAQIESPLQRRVRGTGLGLPLSRRLATVLGGTLTVDSEPGKGSTFTLRVPAEHEEVREMLALEERSRELDPRKAPVLVVEDDRQTLFLYEKYLSASGFQVLPARSVEGARQQLARITPTAIVLDVMLESESTWGFLTELKETAATAHVPVMVVTVVDRGQKARALGADEFWLKPVDGDRLVRKLAELSERRTISRILVVDDDYVARYVMRRYLAGLKYQLFEAENGAEGVKLAREKRPDVIFLDFVLGDTTAFDVLDELKRDPVTRNIPVVIQTAKTLDSTEKERLARETAAILQKQSLSREVAIARIREALLSARGAAAAEP